MRINSLKILIPQNATKFKRMCSSSSPSHFDLVIVGAGMAGSSLACSLAAQNQLSICLVDSIPAKPIPSPLPAIPDLRVFSLNQQSITFLQEIGAWDTIYHTHRNSPYYDIKVWDSQNNASLSFSYLDSNYDCIGNIVEQNIIQGALYQVLQNQPNVQFMCPTKVQSVHLPKKSSEYAQIHFDGGKSITANLVVGGDGANSFIREASGITFKQKDYNQKAIVCSLELDRPHDHTACQRFLPHGPVALLPLYEDHLASIVWTTSLFQFEQLQKLSDEDFIIQLQNAFNERMNSFSLPETIATEGTKFFNSILNRNNVSVPTVPKINRLVGKRAGFPLKLGHAMQYVTPRMALIGDACHVCHPLAGLGINIGFGDVIALRNTINNAIFSGADIGDILALRQYESERKSTNLATIMGIDALSNIFTSTNPLLTLGRGIGITAIDQLAPLKRLFQDRAGTASIHNNS